MTKFVVETLTTFREVHLVEAPDVEKAKKIALSSDYNGSYHLNTDTMTAYEFDPLDLKRFEEADQYFWKGFKTVDEEGCLLYLNVDGTPREQLMKEKIF